MRDLTDWEDKQTFQEATRDQLQAMWEILERPVHPRVLRYVAEWMDGKEKPNIVMPFNQFETSIDYLINWMKSYGR
jgi:hypothetical protein